MDVVSTLDTVRAEYPVEWLTVLLSRHDPTARCAAAMTLARAGAAGSPALPRLRELLDDEDSNVSRLAEWAIRVIVSAVERQEGGTP
jgi:hypothetical protein